MFHRKAIVPPQAASGRQLARTLSCPYLAALGVGAIIGTGILTPISIRADRAGLR